MVHAGEDDAVTGGDRMCAVVEDHVATSFVHKHEVDNVGVMDGDIRRLLPWSVFHQQPSHDSRLEFRLMMAAVTHWAWRWRALGRRMDSPDTHVSIRPDG